MTPDQLVDVYRRKLFDAAIRTRWMKEMVFANADWRDKSDVGATKEDLKVGI